MSATRDYWRKQARNSGIVFVICAVVIALALVGAPVLMFLFHTEIQKTVDSITAVPLRVILLNPSSFQIGIAVLNKLLLIILPLALLIWFARLLVRFANRSLALRDDAQLRQAMMDTYLRLDVDSDLSKDERNVMLSALYRPGPGQAPDLPDFPNVIELIDKVRPG